MSYLLDTNVVSAMRRKDRLAVTTRATIERLPEYASYISVVALMEIHYGIALKARTDPGQAALLQNWLDNVRAAFLPGRTLDVNAPVALICAALHVPDRRPANDALIAATALVHDLTLVTRNVGDFQGIEGLRLLDPWT
ncbi:type II toxin-antitoxin system VapC family toxin [Aurantimonas sp. VKM B-3413]|uniref:type II toxin-antitoxin system VapC family toxin n=1 Tax=Aurantimonas sp. VKM B-3413 TaxID=2779401 RepID=UPI001E5B3BAA|nr:type II toxin-antitoxin system VapC family toxin [Aurantimonas sp. VKM B-3413]MCB8839631.1 type II toxin-antitoxin system VapC family toxin [Aurantimonas sp. VKM B-3413]